MSANPVVGREVVMVSDVLEEVVEVPPVVVPEPPLSGAGARRFVPPSIKN
jgi:hypothetical protein